MHALITNDDGIDSEGIHVLARFVEQAGFDVTVIAPSYNASGTGASLHRCPRRYNWVRSQ